jgi:hypothetical protein
MDRLSAKILRELKKEFPEAGALRVAIGRAQAGTQAGDGEHPVRVYGASESDAVDERVVARARALWDASGGSLTQIQM